MLAKVRDYNNEFIILNHDYVEFCARHPGAVSHELRCCRGRARGRCAHLTELKLAGAAAGLQRVLDQGHAGAGPSRPGASPRLPSPRLCRTSTSTLVIVPLTQFFGLSAAPQLIGALSGGGYVVEQMRCGCRSKPASSRVMPKSNSSRPRRHRKGPPRVSV